MYCQKFKKCRNCGEKSFQKFSTHSRCSSCLYFKEHKQVPEEKVLEKKKKYSEKRKDQKVKRLERKKEIANKHAYQQLIEQLSLKEQKRRCTNESN